MLPNQSVYRISPTGDSHSTILNDIDTRNLQSVRIGESAGTISRGTNNVFAGVGAGTQNTSGSYQTMIGYYAGNSAQNANYTVGIGAFALAQNKGGIENVIIGYRGGEYHISGSRTVSVGAYSGRYNYSGDGNVNVGYASGERNIEGNYNAWVGTEAGQNNRAGSFNTGVGYQAGRASFLANENVYIGAYSGASNSFGNQNTFVGYASGQNNQNGNQNTFVGAYTGANSSLGDANTGLGYNAGANNTSGSSNVWIGVHAGENTSDADGNVIIGTGAAKDIKNGSYNVILGLNAATNSVAADRNVLIGAYVTENIHGDGNTVIGYHTGTNLIHGNENTLVGIGADLYDGSNNRAIVIGPGSLYGGNSSILIGSNITDKNAINILLGETINIDAEYTVGIGNKLAVDNNIIFRDQLFRSYVTAAALDGDRKFGIVIDTTFNAQNSNANYANTLTSPSNISYQYATAAPFNSNTVDTGNPTLNQITPNVYLLNATPFYVIQNGTVLPTITLQIPVWTVLNIVNDTLFNVYVPFVPSGDPSADPLSPLNQIDLSSYLSQHLFFYNLTSPSAYVANIYNLNTTSTLYPISIPKYIQRLQINNTTNTFTIPYQTQNLPTSNWTISYDTTDVGINLYQLNSNNQYYYISQLPKYGVFDNLFYTSNTSNIQYTPFIESINSIADSFQITPNHEIIDGFNYRYGKLSTLNTKTIQISYSNTVLPANTIVFTPLRNISTINTNDIVLPFSISNLWITPIANTKSVPIKITGFDSNLWICYQNKTYNITQVGSIPTFNYSSILQNEISLIANRNSNLITPLQFRIQNQIYSISNIVLSDAVQPSSTIPTTSNIMTVSFQKNLIQRPLYTSTYSNILVSPPLKGILTNLDSSLLNSSLIQTNSFYYQLLDPFNEDSFVIGSTDKTGTSNISTLYQITPTTTTQIQNIVWQQSNLPNTIIYDANSNVYQNFIVASYDIYNTYTTSNNGVQTSLTKVKTPNYDPTTGYVTISSNIVTSNASAIVWNSVDPIYTCNIYYQYTSSNYFFNTIQNTYNFYLAIWQTQQSFSPVTLAENSNYYYPLTINVTTSNFTAFDQIQFYHTSNITVYETRLLNNSLFSLSNVSTNLNPSFAYSNLQVPTSGFNSQLFQIRSNVVVERHVLTYYNDLYLNRQNLFTYRSPTSLPYTYRLQYNTSPIRFTKNNIDITSFTQTDINNNLVRLLVPKTPTQNYNINVTNGTSLSIQLTQPSNYLIQAPSNIILPLGTVTSNNFLDIVSNDGDYTNPIFTTCILKRIENGSVYSLNGYENQRVTSFNKTYIQQLRIAYSAPYGITSDTLTYYYTNANYTVVSDEYTKTLTLNRLGVSYGQAINKGPSPYQNKLDPKLFSISSNQLPLVIRTDTGNLPNNIQLLYQNTIYDNLSSTVLPIPYDDIQLNKVSFQVKDGFDGIPLVTSFNYDVLDATNTVPSLLNQQYPLTLYNQYLFPYGSNATLTIQQYGVTPYQNLWSSTFGNYLSNVQNQTIIQFFLLRDLQNGVLYSTSNNSIVRQFTLDQVNQNDLRYLSYNPDQIDNDTMTLQIGYSNVLSYPYTVTLKNYIAPYKGLVGDTTKISSLGRTVSLNGLGVSKGLLQDGYTWIATNPVLDLNLYPFNPSLCNLSVQLSNLSTNSILNTQTVPVYCIPTSITPTFTTSTITLDVEQANRISLSFLLNYTSFDLSQSQNVWYYVIQHPSIKPFKGVIIDLNGIAYSQFSYTDLINSKIYYQHSGYSLDFLPDTFILGISSTPYDYNTSQTLKVTVNISFLKNLTIPNTHYLYNDTITDALSAHHTLKPLSFTLDSTITTQTLTQTYVHVLSSSNVTLSKNNFTETDLQNDTVFLNINSISYPTDIANSNYSFNFTYNYSTTSNPLVSIPTYQSLFLNTWNAKLNQVTSTNPYLGSISSPQVIQYPLNSNSANYQSLNTDYVQFSLEIRPRQTLNYQTLSTNSTIYADWTTINNHLIYENLRTYYFRVKLVNKLKQVLLQIDFTDQQTTIYALTKNTTVTKIIPTTTATQLSIQNFTLIEYINLDPENNNQASLYIQNTNILQNNSFSPISFKTLQNIALEFDIYHPSNIHQLVTTRYYTNGQNALPYNYNLTNFANIFEMNTFTLQAVRQVETNTQTYNVVLGNTINLEGTNNIYLGYNFNTVGDESIIVGNVIGGTSTNIANDVYQSILIGNRFVQNFSFIRDMICIGNNILNDTNSQLELSDLAKFFNTKPIFIGNDILSTDIIYQINFGNVFLKTVDGTKLLLGRSSENVGIGYTDSSWTPIRKLMVNGGIYTDQIGVGTTPYYQVDVSGTTRTDYLITSNIYASNITVNDTLIAKTLITSNIIIINPPDTTNLFTSNITNYVTIRTSNLVASNILSTNITNLSTITTPIIISSNITNLSTITTSNIITSNATVTTNLTITKNTLIDDQRRPQTLPTGIPFKDGIIQVVASIKDNKFLRLSIDTRITSSASELEILDDGGISTNVYLKDVLTSVFTQSFPFSSIKRSIMTCSFDLTMYANDLSASAQQTTAYGTGDDKILVMTSKQVIHQYTSGSTINFTYISPPISSTVYTNDSTNYTISLFNFVFTPSFSFTARTHNSSFNGYVVGEVAISVVKAA